MAVNLDYAQPMENRIGQVLGQYEIEAGIAEGGMGEVHRARHMMLGSVHVIKLLKPELRQSRQIRQRFFEEGVIQARYRHPNIIQVTDIIDEPHAAGLVMNWMNGQTLRARLDSAGPIAPSQAIRWMMEALDALAYTHSHQIIHRDIKPENLFLEKGWRGGARMKVMDFGIAKVLHKDRTQPQVMMGSQGYMSPEQIVNARDIDGSTDVFAMGAVFFEMLSGVAAFEGNSSHATEALILKGWRPDMAGLVPMWTGHEQLHERLIAVIQRALQPERTDRFTDALSFLEALHAIEEEASRPSSAQEPMREPLMVPSAQATPRNFSMTPIRWLLLVGVLLSLLYVASL